MRQKKPLAILISLIFLVGLFTGCAPAEGPSPTESETAPVTSPGAAITEPGTGPQDQSVTITDMTGRQITLAEPASRIVALTPSDCEILFAIGAGEGLVGRGEYCNYPEAVLEAPAVQSGANTNLEQIIDLAPQVLLMSTMAQSKEQVATLEAAGIQVVVSDADDIEGVYTAIAMIGTLMGKADQAQTLIDSMKASFLSVSAKADEWAGKRIYFEVSPLEWGLWTAGSGTFMDEIAQMIGLDNIFADVEGWAEVSEEQVLARDPDYILTISMYFGEGPKPVEEILGRTGWENVGAVKNVALLNLPNDELSRPGPRLAEGAEILFDFILETEATLNSAS